MISTIKGTLILRADTEAEAISIIDKAKKNPHFVLSKYSTEVKEIKEKGEVIDTYYLVTIAPVFNDVKAPENEVYVYATYNQDTAEAENAGVDEDED